MARWLRMVGGNRDLNRPFFFNINKTNWGDRLTADRPNNIVKQLVGWLGNRGSGATGWGGGGVGGGGRLALNKPPGGWERKGGFPFPHDTNPGFHLKMGRWTGKKKKKKGRRERDTA